MVVLLVVLAAALQQLLQCTIPPDMADVKLGKSSFA